MVDFLSPQQRSRLMAAVRPQNNKTTELALVVLLKQAKIVGWRRHRDLPGRPDFVFTKAKLAVFVDGCFWHGCTRCRHLPEANREFWRRKLEGNRRRDMNVNSTLKRMGWNVVRIWEHEFSFPARILRKIHARLK